MHSSLTTVWFPNHLRANSAVEALLRSGVRREDVSLVLSESAHPVHTTSQEQVGNGAAAGAAAGGTVGAILAALLAVGSLAVPGAGIVVAGPIIAALAGAGVGGAAGGLMGALVSAGVREEEATHYAKHLESDGGILVCVHSPNEAAAASSRAILHDAGGVALKAA